MESAPNQDDLIIKQQEEIQKTIAASSDLVSNKLPLKVLEDEFANDEVYRTKIAKLSDQYSEFRRIRPDGNCFFRAVGFRLFEWLLDDSIGISTWQYTDTKIDRMRDIGKASPPRSLNNDSDGL